MSSDPEFCDVCGSDLSATAKPDAWLDLGSTITLAITRPKPVRVEPAPASFDDTLPPPGIRSAQPTDQFTRQGTGQLTPVAPADDDLTVETNNPNARSRSLSQTVTAVGTTEFEAALIDAETPEEVTITIDSMITQLGHKRVWVGSDDVGTNYRIEERSTPSQERVPTGINQLAIFVDIPLGQTSHGGHEVKVYRSVAGKLLHERLDERDSPLTPTEIVEWTRPIVLAMEAIHAAGFFCLRICPYSVKYPDSGDGIFLQGVEVLYPQDAALTKLPAIAGYTAPEVYEASVGDPLSGAADVYSIAMIVYYLIAGADPPASLYTGYTPAILARDHNPEFPLGFAPVLGEIGALDPSERPADAGGLLAAIENARDRSVRQVAGIDRLRVTAAVDTHVGIIKKLHTPQNQDSVFTACDETGSSTLIVVADGVSTASFGSGDIASQIAIACSKSAWKTYMERPDVVRERGVGQWLNDLFQRINRDLVEAVNAEFAPFSGEPSEVMGSTCLIAFIQNGIAHLLTLGDSRAYLLRTGFMEQISRDHNLLTLGIADGIDPDTAFMLPQGAALAKCLGSFDVHEGRLEAVDVEPDVYVFPLLAGDRLLMCTDGLTDYAGVTVAESEARIYDTVMAGELPELICLDLIRLANAGGGGDNVGVGVCIADPKFPGPIAWFTQTREEAESALDR